MGAKKPKTGMDSITFENGFTDQEASAIAAASSLMVGPGAIHRLNFIQSLRERFESKALQSSILLDRSTASCFRTGIIGGCHVQGRTDPEINLLLKVAGMLKIRSWIELPPVEEYDAPFDAPSNIPFDGDSE